METSNSSKSQKYQNAVLAHSTIFKIVETIEKRIKAGHVNKDLEELVELRELCSSEDPLVSVTACHALVSLVKANICPLSNTITALVASLFSLKNETGVVSALTELLVLELKYQLSTAAPAAAADFTYCRATTQHPLVSVLKRKPLAWPLVLNQLSTIATTSDKQVQKYCFELVKPVLDYVLFEKNDLPESCRLQAFRIILSHFHEKEYLIDALACCLCWDNSRVLEVVEIVTLISQSAINNKHGLQVSLCCLALAVLVPRLLQTANSPQPVLQLLSQLTDNAATTHTHSTLLAILADSIPACPTVYLNNLLAFVTELIGRGHCTQDCTWMCVSALLPWLACNANHLRNALHTASLIVSQAQTATANPSTTASLINNSAVMTVVAACPRLTQAVHIARLSEVLRDKDAVLRWLEKNQSINEDLVHMYVSALMISRSEGKVRLAALQALVSSAAAVSCSHNLTLFLYQLAKEKTPENQLRLLQALPSTAVDKNNVLGVISTLEALRRSSNSKLAVLAVELYCELWKNQERCYPKLVEVLDQDWTRSDKTWTNYTLQASICKTICTAKPELHGKELVAKVSEILNKCGGVKEAAASSLALEALVPLCRQDVVDVFTIWRSLEPRFARDRRPLVIISLCELVSVGAKQKCTSAAAADSLKQMLSWLWNLVVTNKNPTVVNHALKSLSKFTIDKMTLKMLPSCFRKDLKLPSEMIKTPADLGLKPEDVLDYIPGECWAQVVKEVGTQSACEAVTSWLRMEIASYRGSSLYQVDRQEPTDYGRLPRSSVVRGVTAALQTACKPTEDSTPVNLYLTILLQPTSKPLPSLSWEFLAPLATAGDKEVARNVVKLCAKQSQVSPSARNITQAAIASADSKEKIEFIYSILIDLCRGIPPTVLRTFIEKTLQSALKEADCGHLSTLLKQLKATLKEEKIHEANRVMLQQQIKILWDNIEPQHQMLEEYFACACELPVSLIESMTSTSTMWEVTSTHLQKAFRFRAFMALLPNAVQPLNWLNEIIDVASSNITEQSLALQLVSEVTHQLRKDPSAWPWLQELMGQTHLSSTKNQGNVEFLVSVFVKCVDVFSGFALLSSSDDSSLRLRLPQAVISLVNQHGEAKSMFEWLNHMKSIDSFPNSYAMPFQLAARNLSLRI